MSDSLAEIDTVFGSEYTFLDRFTNGALSSFTVFGSVDEKT